MTAFNATSSNYSLTGNALNNPFYADRFDFNAMAEPGLVSGTMDIRRPGLPFSLSRLVTTDLVL